MFNRLSRQVLLGLGMFISVTGYVNASCSFLNGKSFTTETFNFGDVIVLRDKAVGTELVSKYGKSWGNPFFTCSSTFKIKNELTMFSTATSLDGVYATNIKGIGLRVGPGNKPFPYTSSGYPANTQVNQGAKNVALIRTTSGDVGAGKITSGKIASISTQDVQGEMALGAINMGTANIIPIACSINTPSLTFQIGDIPIDKFGSTVGTIPSGAQNTQNLGLACDSGANINVELSGTQNPDISNTSVLALTGHGDDNVASGVGVQILYNGSPLKLNNRIVLKKSSGGQETFPLTARYYQTKTAVTTGTANTSATLNITYQ